MLRKEIQGEADRQNKTARRQYKNREEAGQDGTQPKQKGKTDRARQDATKTEQTEKGASWARRGRQPDRYVETVQGKGTRRGIQRSRREKTE